jgi:putative glutamine amidotransferase
MDVAGAARSAVLCGMRRPVIGITTYREEASWGVWRRSADLLGARYTDAVVAAGGAPVLLPPVPSTALDVVHVLDGLVLAGGADLDPERYGAIPDPATGPPRRDRDDTELLLARVCVDRGTPLLAICRGMQVLNVALGGDLVQHLPDVPGSAPHRGKDAVFHPRPVRVAPDTALQSIVGQELDVHCYHHQAVGRLGEGLRAVAWSEDGVVEAVEPAVPSGFVLGVQAHPEESDDRRLFAALVAASHG